jgi:hypothetical protein
MEYKNKYLKYKTKYLELKKQKGGEKTAEIFLIINNYDEINKIINNLTFEKIINGQKINQKKAIILLEDKIKETYNQLKYSQIRDPINNNDLGSLIIEIYDYIGLIYMCSMNMHAKYNRIAQNTNSNIRIFTGENSVCKTIEEDNFIEGINILATCISSDRAIERNNLNNNKKFLGIKGFLHLYSDKFYTCMEGLNLTRNEFIQKYEEYIEYKPLIRLIKIIHDKFQERTPECPNCRDCRIISLEKIEQKINNIQNKREFIKNDHIINDTLSHQLENCKHLSKPCKEELEYITYFDEILNEMYAKKDKLINAASEYKNIKDELEKYFDEQVISEINEWIKIKASSNKSLKCILIRNLQNGIDNKEIILKNLEVQLRFTDKRYIDSIKIDPIYGNQIEEEESEYEYNPEDLLEEDIPADDC